jgi:hypothetical protein
MPRLSRKRDQRDQWLGYCLRLIFVFITAEGACLSGYQAHNSRGKFDKGLILQTWHVQTSNGMRYFKKQNFLPRRAPHLLFLELFIAYSYRIRLRRTKSTFGNIVLIIRNYLCYSPYKFGKMLLKLHFRRSQVPFVALLIPYNRYFGYFPTWIFSGNMF